MESRARSTKRIDAKQGMACKGGRLPTTHAPHLHKNPGQQAADLGEGHLQEGRGGSSSALVQTCNYGAHGTMPHGLPQITPHAPSSPSTRLLAGGQGGRLQRLADLAAVEEDGHHEGAGEGRGAGNSRM